MAQAYVPVELVNSYSDVYEGIKQKLRNGEEVKPVGVNGHEEEVLDYYLATTRKRLWEVGQETEALKTQLDEKKALTRRLNDCLDNYNQQHKAVTLQQVGFFDDGDELVCTDTEDDDGMVAYFKLEGKRIKVTGARVALRLNNDSKVEILDEENKDP